MNKIPTLYYHLFSYTAQKLALEGVRYAVLCPGSRSAPIALSFLRNKKIKCFTVNDERSAAYIALGLSLFSDSAVVLVSTSGTAALNFSPAVAEAFNQKIPLLIFTADRPAHFIDRGENQTIRQYRLYEPNIEESFQIVAEEFENDLNNFNQLLNLIIGKLNFGPVHVNVPLNEPLYNNNYEISNFSIKPSIKNNQDNYLPGEKIVELLSKNNKILIVPGLFRKNKKLEETIDLWSKKFNAVVIHDITSNIHCAENLIKRADHCINNSKNPDLLKPDLLITFGSFTVSKKIKEFLRKYSPLTHLHLDKHGYAIDTYFCLSDCIKVNPHDFFSETLKFADNLIPDNSYLNIWKNYQSKAEIDFQLKLKSNSELNFINELLKQIPDNSIIHLGNSMVVRYANEAGIPVHKSCEVFSNRGTSGIDGSLSAAIGVALCSEKLNYLIIGDQSFIYDRNALWNNYIPQNLKIIVINNKGGNIFRQLKGASSQPELNSYFVNHVPVDIAKIAESHSIPYYYLNDTSSLLDFLDFKTIVIGEFQVFEK